MGTISGGNLKASLHPPLPFGKGGSFFIILESTIQQIYLLSISKMML
jgi:hypothetical protein